MACLVCALLCFDVRVCFSHACVRPCRKTEKANTGSLRTPLQRQIYIHPSRLTLQLRTGSGADRVGPHREAEIVGGQGEIQRACQRWRRKDHERADLYDRCHNYDESLRYLY